MSLLEKLMKNSTIKDTEILDRSTVFNEKDNIPTAVPAINIALSGRPDGGLTPGLLQIAGPSKHFKSAFTLLIASSYLKKYKDGVILFYDSEFGTPESYFDSLNIPKNRVIHTPITNVEEFKHDIMTQLQAINRGDKVCIVVDSIGNLASKKEVDDAIEGKSAADMTRAKALKSLGRMVTPHLSLKDIPMIVVNHTYKEIGMFPKDIVSGGTGMYLSSDNIWILGRQQDKDSDGLNGFHYIINIEKSRHVREKTKIPVSVSFEEGLFKWSGLFDMAIEADFIAESKKGWYKAMIGAQIGEIDPDKQYRRADFESANEFWEEMLEPDGPFYDYIKRTYKLGKTKLVQEDKGDA